MSAALPLPSQRSLEDSHTAAHYGCLCESRGICSHCRLSNLTMTSLLGSPMAQEVLEYADSLLQIWADDTEFMEQIELHMESGYPNTRVEIIYFAMQQCRSFLDSRTAGVA